MALLNTRVKAAGLKQRAQPCRMTLAQSCAESEPGESNQSWHISRQQIRSNFELVCQNHPRVGPSSHWVPAPAHLAPVLLPSGAKVPVLRGQRPHTQREDSQLGLDLQDFSRNLGPILPIIGWYWSLIREEALAHA